MKCWKRKNRRDLHDTSSERPRDRQARSSNPRQSTSASAEINLMKDSYSSFQTRDGAGLSNSLNLQGDPSLKPFGCHFELTEAEDNTLETTLHYRYNQRSRGQDIKSSANSRNEGFHTHYIVGVFQSAVETSLTHPPARRTSSTSTDSMCRICHGGDSFAPELGRLICTCACRGSVGLQHRKCLERWLTESGSYRCELCGTEYYIRRVYRFGVLHSLAVWTFTQNSKQLLVDGLGIMLMTPIAALAAWMSSRSLGTLVAVESPDIPWLLASLFVLSCFTLVCYYYWLVSAATRHASGWWSWHCAQFQVRLLEPPDD